MLYPNPTVFLFRGTHCPPDHGKCLVCRSKSDTQRKHKSSLNLRSMFYVMALFCPVWEILGVSISEMSAFSTAVLILQEKKINLISSFWVKIAGAENHLQRTTQSEPSGMKGIHTLFPWHWSYLGLGGGFNCHCHIVPSCLSWCNGCWAVWAPMMPFFFLLILGLCRKLMILSRDAGPSSTSYKGWTIDDLVVAAILKRVRPGLFTAW